MKALTTLAAIAALCAGMSIANAQNVGGTADPNESPSNINKGEPPSHGASQSGNESTRAANMPAREKGRRMGKAKFCIQVSKSGGGLECNFATMEACTQEAQPRGLQCSENPRMTTTGSRQ